MDKIEKIKVILNSKKDISSLPNIDKVNAHLLDEIFEIASVVYSPFELFLNDIGTDKKITINYVIWKYHSKYIKILLPYIIKIEINGNEMKKSLIKNFFEFLYIGDICALKGDNEDMLYYLLFAKTILMDEKILLIILQKINFYNGVVDIINKIGLGYLIYNMYGCDIKYIINDKEYNLHTEVILKKSKFFENNNKYKNILGSHNSNEIENTLNEINIVDHSNELISTEYIDMVIKYLYGLNKIKISNSSSKELYHFFNVSNFLGIEFDNAIIGDLMTYFEKIDATTIMKTIDCITFNKNNCVITYDINYITTLFNKNENNIKNIKIYSDGHISTTITYNDDSVKKKCSSTHCDEFLCYIENIIEQVKDMDINNSNRNSIKNYNNNSLKKNKKIANIIEDLIIIKDRRLRKYKIDIDVYDKLLFDIVGHIIKENNEKLYDRISYFISHN